MSPKSRVLALNTLLLGAATMLIGVAQASPADDAVRGAVLPTTLIGAVDDGTIADVVDAQAATEELPVIAEADEATREHPTK